jgi:3-phenylpropionate/trans-cinnamate dioxygenase ferredoxin reductase component
MKKIIIIGGSHAGVHAAFTLRNQMPDAEIEIFSDEAHYPYHRPPLSKKSLQEDASLDDILIKPKSLYDKQNIVFKANTKVLEINANDSKIKTNDGIFGYDHLILATGGSPRRLEIPGVDPENILYVRDYNDAVNLKTRVKNAQSILLIGGGYIGLETAASLNLKGKKVAIIEAADRILNRVVCPQMSDYYQAYHENEGVKFYINDHIVDAKKQADSSYLLNTSKGESLSTELVVVGIGITPNITLAEQAGIFCKNGIKVNKFCQTNFENIYAIGDCANYYHEHYSQSLRIESVQNATEQARISAFHIANKPFKEPGIPWFWSDQYDLNLKMVGLSMGYKDIIIRGNIQENKFACFYITETKVLAVDTVNSPGEFMAAKRIITNNRDVDISLLKDETISISEVIKLWQV